MKVSIYMHQSDVFVWEEQKLILTIRKCIISHSREPRGGVSSGMANPETESDPQEPRNFPSLSRLHLQPKVELLLWSLGGLSWSLRLYALFIPSERWRAPLSLTPPLHPRCNWSHPYPWIGKWPKLIGLGLDPWANHRQGNRISKLRPIRAHPWSWRGEWVGPQPRGLQLVLDFKKIQTGCRVGNSQYPWPCLPGLSRRLHKKTSWKH